MPLVTITGIDNFYRTKDFATKSQLIHRRYTFGESLHETEELEPWDPSHFLFDTNEELPSWPSEIADIFTHKLTV